VLGVLALQFGPLHALLYEHLGALTDVATLTQRASNLHPASYASHFFYLRFSGDSITLDQSCQIPKCDTNDFTTPGSSLPLWAMVRVLLSVYARAIEGHERCRHAPPTIHHYPRHPQQAPVSQVAGT
jgi:hypothetical protein